MAQTKNTPKYSHAAKAANTKLNDSARVPRSQLSVKPGLKTPGKEITAAKTVNDIAMRAMSSAKKKSPKQAEKNPNYQNNSESVPIFMAEKPAEKEGVAKKSSFTKKTSSSTS